MWHQAALNVDKGEENLVGLTRTKKKRMQRHLHQSIEILIIHLLHLHQYIWYILSGKAYTFNIFERAQEAVDLFVDGRLLAAALSDNGVRYVAVLSFDIFCAQNGSSLCRPQVCTTFGSIL